MRTLEEFEEKIGSKERHALRTYVRRMRELLKADDVEAIRELMGEMKEMCHDVSKVIHGGALAGSEDATPSVDREGSKAD
jgi:ribosomal protein S20